VAKPTKAPRGDGTGS